MWSVDFGNSKASIVSYDYIYPLAKSACSPDGHVAKVKNALAANPLPSPVCRVVSAGYMDYLPLWTFYWHFHDDAAEFAIVENGEGIFHVGLHEVPIQRGSVCLIPPHVLHYFSSTEENPLKYYVIELDISDSSSALYPWLTSDAARVIQMERYADHLLFFVHTLNAHLSKNQLHIDPEYQASVFSLVSWVRYHPKDVEERYLSPDGFVLEKPLKYISAHFAETITLNDLCNMINVSSATLNRLFSRYCNLSPINYVIYYRITQALRVLQYTELSVFDVANAVGYQNQTHFSRHFFRFMGCTPAHFRKRLRAMLSEFSDIP